MFPRKLRLNHNKTKKFLSEFSSPDGQKIARIYFGDTQTKIKVDSDRTKAVLVNELEQCFSIDFYYKNRKEGTLSYPELSLRYVEDAAENWALGVFDLQELRFKISEQRTRNSTGV